jgi:putative endonuclease
MSLRGGALPPKQSPVARRLLRAKNALAMTEDAVMAERNYCVYILTNAHNTVLYTGVTNDLKRRVFQHKNGQGGTFTKKYNVHKLVYYEVGDDIHVAIWREKQIKAGSRQKKIDLVNSLNPKWEDLYDEI